MRDLAVDAATLEGFDLDALPAGSRTRLRLAVPGVEDTHLPVMALRGARPGPTVVVCGGVHGDEFEARAGLRQLFASLDADAYAGRLLGLPICNPWAFRAHTRCSPPERDGRNLAREFPGDPGGTDTQRLAFHLGRLLARHAGEDDLVVDLHSGGTFYTYRSMAGYRDHPGPALDASREAARHTGLECLWAIDAVPGTLTQFAAEHGIPAVGTEFRGQGGARPQDVAACVTALRGLLTFMGALDGAPPPRDVRRPLRTTTVVSPAAGFVPALPELGATVEAGWSLCEVLDEDDATVAVVDVPVGGELWAVRSFPAVAEDDILALIAHP